jgi:hypothetical protein
MTKCLSWCAVVCCAASTSRQVTALRGKIVTQVSCGDAHTLIVADFLPYAVGGGEYGQLGLGPDVRKSHTPLVIDAVGPTWSLGSSLVTRSSPAPSAGHSQRTPLCMPCLSRSHWAPTRSRSCTPWAGLCPRCSREPVARMPCATARPPLWATHRVRSRGATGLQAHSVTTTRPPSLHSPPFASLRSVRLDQWAPWSRCPQRPHSPASSPLEGVSLSLSRFALFVCTCAA